VSRSTNDLILELEKFEFFEQYQLPVCLFIPILRDKVLQNVHHVPYSRVVDFLKVLVSIIDNTSLGNSGVLHNPIFNKGRLKLNNKPYWTLSPDLRQLILWDGEHGPLFYHKFLRGNSNSKWLIHIEMNYHLCKTLNFSTPNIYTQMITDFGYIYSEIKLEDGSVLGYYNKP
jgi:hypothetical protein